MVKLSILICHVPDKIRTPMLNDLLENLNEQIQSIEEFVEISVDAGDGSIGTKRNRLLQAAKGQYIAFVDDDDEVSADYVFELLRGIDRGVDACSLRGLIFESGAPARLFEHSYRHKAYETVSIGGELKYLRYPNHLNCIKASIAKQFRFPEINHGEDTSFATQIFNSGLIKSEHWIEDILYYYTPSDTRK